MRMAGALVIAAGGALLASSPAAAASKAKTSCDDFAAGFAAGVCANQGKSVVSYSYYCSGPNAHPLQISVTCG
ncbi:hypothetical protein [Longimicrobium sp.]|uniref:hypothetical protein n=1 Tax=Longimicrobium sp. TaxID=2029185 RepID=UPI002D7E27BF|nr:hypothetical protein [Longimicrobium sp.]